MESGAACRDMNDVWRAWSGQVNERLGRVTKLEKRIAVLEKLIAQFVCPQVKSLSERPTLKYRGIYSEEEQYNPGDFVTKNGSVWHCNKTVFGAAPGDNFESWTLAVKAGRNLRDAPTVMKEA